MKFPEFPKWELADPGLGSCVRVTEFDVQEDMKHRPDSKVGKSLAESQIGINVEFVFLLTKAAIGRGATERRILGMRCSLGFRDIEWNKCINKRKQEGDT